MDIINDTRINVVTSNLNESLYLITEVTYDVDTLLNINKVLTYAKVFKDEITEHSINTTLFYAHELTDRMIRDFRLEFNAQIFSPSNAQTFIEFFKDYIGFKKFEKQSVAHLAIPTIKAGDQFRCGFVKSSGMSFKLNTPPWEVIQNLNYRKQSLTPFVHTINYFVQTKQLTALFLYPIHSKGFITITYRETDKKC